MGEAAFPRVLLPTGPCATAQFLRSWLMAPKVALVTARVTWAWAATRAGAEGSDVLGVALPVTLPAPGGWLVLRVGRPAGTSGV